MTVDEYYSAFIGLIHLLPDLGYADRILVNRFYNGLSYRLRYGMGPTGYTTLQYHAAAIVEITVRLRDEDNALKRMCNTPSKASRGYRKLNYIITNVATDITNTGILPRSDH